MRLFDNRIPDYVRLDDDVSFQIVRTNPKLTTNTKLVYDGENIYMDSYSANPLLSTMDYKHHRVWKSGLFNRDIRNFLLGTNTAAFTVGQSVDDTIILNDFDNQYENMYWCGVESINSNMYPQEMGCIAPLYLRKKRPNYFVIFRIDSPLNLTKRTAKGFKFYEDVKKNAKIIKTFDLREGTPIGDYISRYVEQRGFEYDKSVYVNFSSHEIYYYGIDKTSGVLTTRVENIEKQLLNNDNTIMRSDDWITSGFERNNLIFPYIINFEFLFDDDEIEEFKFARYFGMYCNDIDLYDVDVMDCIYDKSDNSTIVTTQCGSEDNVITDDSQFYYIKDKYNNIYSSKSTYVLGHYQSPGNLKKDDFSGYEISSVSTFAERVDGFGKAFLVLEIVETPDESAKVIFKNTIYNTSNYTDDSDSDYYSEGIKTTGTFISTSECDSGTFNRYHFSCLGTTVDVAKALAGALNACDYSELNWISSFSFDNKVIIQAKYPGTNLNKLFDVTFDTLTKNSGKIVKVTKYFNGGTDVDGCLFKVYTSDKDIFVDTSNDRDADRYIKCGVGRNHAKVESFMPYINDEKKIDDTYSLVVTDSYGQYININSSEQIEIIDKFYAKLGVLSFFPVRDFDFDTISSVYGNYEPLKKELNLTKFPSLDDDGNQIDTPASESISYGRFYHIDNKLDTEYEYFFENVIPELSTVNKSVPYIAKWGYIDESKDSCENPYRLNTSKIFEACNFSANTYMQRGDIMEYTHSMPYYVNNKYLKGKKDNLIDDYQYVSVDNSLWNNSYSGGELDSMISVWATYFLNKNTDRFFEVFGDTSSTDFKSKRYNKKYSRFLLGNTISKSSTLFRGIKFEISEIKNGEEVYTGKYNEYRFSFIYVPVNEIKNNNHTVYFIKNDTFRFIVGIVFFDIKKSLSKSDFNKAYIYAGSMGFIETDGIIDNSGGDDIIYDDDSDSDDGGVSVVDVNVEAILLIKQ